VNNSDKFWYFVALALSSPMNVLGLFLLMLLGWILWRGQHDKNNKAFDLNYVLVDTTVGTITLAKFGGFSALLASTWVLIDLTVTGHFDSPYAIAYIAGWGGFKVATDYMLRNDGHRDG
jgi:hypothetical protein